MKTIHLNTLSFYYTQHQFFKANKYINFKSKLTIASDPLYQIKTNIPNNNKNNGEVVNVFLELRWTDRPHLIVKLR